MFKILINSQFDRLSIGCQFEKSIIFGYGIKIIYLGSERGYEQTYSLRLIRSNLLDSLANTLKFHNPKKHYENISLKTCLVNKSVSCYISAFGKTICMRSGQTIIYNLNTQLSVIQENLPRNEVLRRCALQYVK